MRLSVLLFVGFDLEEDDVGRSKRMERNAGLRQQVLDESAVH